MKILEAFKIFGFMMVNSFLFLWHTVIRRRDMSDFEVVVNEPIDDDEDTLTEESPDIKRILYLIVSKKDKMICGAYKDRETAEFELLANRHSRLPPDELQIEEVINPPKHVYHKLVSVYKVRPDTWN